MDHAVKRPIVRTGTGQNSHRFLPEDSSKLCVLGGVIFENVPGLSSESDGDVIFHAICNAISSVTGVPILGGIARELFQKDGITDSAIYLEKALETLGLQTIQHVALTVEGKRPKFQPRIDEMRTHIAKAMNLNFSQVGLTVTSGDGLTDFGCGDGLQCFCIITTIE